MKYFKDLVKENGHELKHYKEPLPQYHKAMTVFDYSIKYGQQYGGTYDSFKYYNDYYVDLGIDKQSIYDEICRVLTDYEGNGDDNEDRGNPELLYRMLVKIQNNWEDIIKTKE